MILSLMVPTSPIFSPKKVSSIFCNSNDSSFPSSPRINDFQAPPSPSRSSLPLSSPKSPLPLSSTSITTPQSPSTSQSSSLTSSLSLCVPNQQLSSRADAAPSVVKRKRPARIEISTPMTVKLGFAVETPRGEKELQVDGEVYFVYCKRGKRGKWKDPSIVIDLNEDSKQVFFSIFYGHSKAVEFATKNLDKKEMARYQKDEIF